MKYCAVVVLTCLAPLFLSIQTVQSANILGIFTSHGPSHVIVHMSMMKALAERGHNITVVLSQQPKVTHKSIKQIIIPPTKEQATAMDDVMSGRAREENSLLNNMKMMFTALSVMMDMQFDAINDKRFTILYELPDTKFDVVFVGYFFNDYQFGVAAKFGCPLIMSWSGAQMEIVDKYIGNPYERAYVPNVQMAVKPGERMTFMQRVQNLITGQVFNIMVSIMNYKMESYYERLFPKDNFPTYDDMKKNISLVLINAHFSEGIIRPNVPGLIEVGGIQIKDKPNPLPEDIAKHLKKAKEHGAILFSLGSVVKSTNFKPETMNNIYKVLSKIKQNVIWKWEDMDNTPGNASNILFKKWLPQDDILAHPNLRLFITHAGKGGITEASYHGVPMLALPVFGDQTGNAERMVGSGYGLQLNLLSLKGNELRDAINEILSNPKYKAEVARFSTLYRDRPLSAKESVVYWTEYVIRNEGAAHMQSPLLHMNWIQAANLDVYVFLIAIVYLAYRLVKAIYCLAKYVIFKKLCKKSKNSDKLKQN